MARVEYSSNNSGGDWWLKDEDWYALEEAGWDVEWRSHMENPWPSERATGRWLGALATRAFKEFRNPDDAIGEFERITGQDASAQGCNCCGPPHSFSYTDENGRYHSAYPQVVETWIEFD
jgi:hypothetical protein